MSNFQLLIDRAAAMTVPCRSCKAHPGEPCRNLVSGRELEHLPAHLERLTEAGVTQ